MATILFFIHVMATSFFYISHFYISRSVQSFYRTLFLSLLLLLLLTLLFLLTLAIMLAEKLEVMSRKDRKPKAEKLLPRPHISPDLEAEMQKGAALCCFFQVVLIFARKKETKKGYFRQAPTHPKLRIPSLFFCGTIFYRVFGANQMLIFYFFLLHLGLLI